MCFNAEEIIYMYIHTDVKIMIWILELFLIWKDLLIYVFFLIVLTHF